jgi:molybdenum cofactor cytidylyltransferase
MIPGVILASGVSSRMGRSKALLSVGSNGPSFVRHIATTLLEGGVSDVLVIGRPEDAALRSEVEQLGARVRFVENPNAAHGQLSSVVAGINAVDHPGTRAVVITPVDVPLVRAASVAAVIDAFVLLHAPIVRATSGGRHGHPVLFAHPLFGELRRADPAVGAKSVMRAHEAEIANVEVADPGVLTDVDSPEDYERLFGPPL